MIFIHIYSELHSNTLALYLCQNIFEVQVLGLLGADVDYNTHNVFISESAFQSPYNDSR